MKRVHFITAAVTAITLLVPAGHSATAKTKSFTVASSSREITSADPSHQRYAQDIQTSPAIKGASCYLAYEDSRQNASGLYVFLRDFTQTSKTNAKGKTTINFVVGLSVQSALDVYTVCTYKGVTATDDPSIPAGMLGYQTN